MTQSSQMTQLETVGRPSTDQDTVLEMQNQIQNLCKALKEKEVETRRLKKSLRFYQKETKMRTSLYPDLESQLMTTRDELMVARKAVEEETDVATGLRYELSQKDQEIGYYKKENERLRRRVIGLEIDLDTHDIHMTDYAERQCQLEEVVLSEFEGETKTAEVVLEIEEQFGSRIQDLISKQIIDYSTLEDRYKRDQAECKKKITDLLSTIADLEASVVVLESRISGEKSVKFSLKPSSNIYRERINVLEKSIARLIATNDHLTGRIESLELSLSRPSRLVQEAEACEGTTHDIDKRLRESQRKIAFLTRDIEFKEKRNTLLRAQAITYQLRNLPPNDFDSKMGPSDDHKRYCIGKDETYQIDEERKTDYLEYESASQLQEQLQVLQETLLRKDREIAEQQRLSQEREDVLSVQLDEARNTSGDTKGVGHAQFFL